MRTLLISALIFFTISADQAHALDLLQLEIDATAACERAMTLHQAEITSDTVYQIVLCATWKQGAAATSQVDTLDLMQLNADANTACEQAMIHHKAAITNESIYEIVLCAIWKLKDS